MLVSVKSRYGLVSLTKNEGDFSPGKASVSCWPRESFALVRISANWPGKDSAMVDDDFSSCAEVFDTFDDILELKEQIEAFELFGVLNGMVACRDPIFCGAK
jgi:hypothetical protein